MPENVERLHQEVVSLIKGGHEKINRRVDILEEQFINVRADMDRPYISDGPSGLSPQSSSRFVTPASKINREFKDQLGLVRQLGRVSFAVGQLFPSGDFETRLAPGMTLIDSSAVGSSTPGILVPSRIPGTVPLARRRLTLRDLLTSRPTDSNAVEFIREAAFTNAASPQVEGSAKSESALTFVVASESIRTLAHWVPATRQVLDDFTELRRAIDSSLLYGLAVKEEAQILSGSGAGENYNGLTAQATAYAGTYAVGADTRLDKLRHAIAELEVADEAANFIVLHPADMHYIDLIKDQATNIGNYVVGDPVGGGGILVRTLWGRTVVVTNSMTSGYFLVGDKNMCELRDRLNAEVMISTEHDDFFVKNKVAIRAELRACLAVFRTTAFCYGAF